MTYLSSMCYHQLLASVYFCQLRIDIGIECVKDFNLLNDPLTCIVRSSSPTKIIIVMQLEVIFCCKKVVILSYNLL